MFKCTSYLVDNIVLASDECCLPTLPFLVVRGTSVQHPADCFKVLQGLSPRHQVELESFLRNDLNR